jgi:NAD(P)-dependent dehydrogenase (short-subunit alcohol dehydrogenase family)
VNLNQSEALEVSRDPFHTALDPSDILLTGQAAIVTGAGGGIGQGIALGLAKFGADVAVLDIDPERAERTAASITELGREALALPVDVMDTERLTAAVEQAAAHFGHLNILVNNAGGVSARLFLEQSERSWRRHIDINLVSMLAATHAAAPLMKESGGGSIVNVTSIEGFRAAPMYAVYAACKAGMINFTMTMALELSEHHIRINALAPDQTITPGLRGNRAGPVDPSTWPERGAEGPNGTLRSIPSGREGVIEDLAAAAVFLCSPMGAYITGTTINVDGGTNAARGWIGTPSEGWSLTH